VVLLLLLLLLLPSDILQYLFSSPFPSSFSSFSQVITYIACSTFVLEALGDVPGFEDKFIDTAMGSVSFFQSCYYAFMLMSTVGFGDFSPQTVGK
jgi:hypothetical protein